MDREAGRPGTGLRTGPRTPPAGVTRTPRPRRAAATARAAPTTRGPTRSGTASDSMTTPTLPSIP
ncbi:hypothetical protein KQH31_08895, partial [Streptomyces sp. CHA15]|uniref:hypothetical protein n=1 Tax=Streptomyces sp. CHA15 TaxID=2841668 RepID=UPI0038D0F5FD|nr:hypothetical protein [Streptomyces sp. CHA15]